MTVLKRIFIWGIGKDYGKCITILKYLECIKDIQIVGITSKTVYGGSIDGYRFIRKDQLTSIEFDYLLITPINKYKTIYNEAIAQGVENDKIVSSTLLYTVDFSFGKYEKFKKAKISIIANNCWGGLIYHYFQSPFLSPFINMFENDNDYICLLKNLKQYMELPLRFKKTAYNSVSQLTYPVCTLSDDVELHMNHYSDFEQAQRKWEERKKRINWNNLFVMMYTENPIVLEQFNTLLYEKKICFVPFKTDNPSGWYLNTDIAKESPFWSIVNGLGNGQYAYYNLWDMLLHGEKVLRVK